MKWRLIFLCIFCFILGEALFAQTDSLKTSQYKFRRAYSITGFPG